MINLGATCYMASCMQQLYMMPEARASILRVQVLSQFVLLNASLHQTISPYDCHAGNCLSYPILSYPIPSHPILSHPILSSP